MKTSTKRVLAAVALLAAACASAASAQKSGDINRDGVHFYGLGELFSFDGINVERRDGAVVGVSVLLGRGDGSWLTLRQQTSLTCAADCPEGQRLSCWGDERGTVGVCFCVSPTGPGGTGTDPARKPRIVIVAPDNTTPTS